MIMHYLRKRLPPLGALTAFEAAARHLSFTRAAEELNLTQAAISRQIKALEDDLGVRLFVRANRRVTLTAEGRQLLHAAAPALAQIANAAEQVRTTGGNVRINVATDQSVAALWLADRLGDFRKRHPDIAVRLVVSDNEADCLADANDIAIVHGSGDWPGFDSRELFGEAVFPVCSPAFAERHGPIRTPADLARLPLIELEDDHWDWISWRVWLTQIGVDRPTEGPRLQINNYPLVLDAAARGEGIALGWRHLADRLIADGRLVRPLSDLVETDFGYHVLLPTVRPVEPAVSAFSDWLSSAAP
ncbi:MAG: transcriptional regulator GcvA [Rhodospirillales bacterium]